MFELAGGVERRAGPLAAASAEAAAVIGLAVNPLRVPSSSPCVELSPTSGKDESDVASVELVLALNGNELSVDCEVVVRRGIVE